MLLELLESPVLTDMASALQVFGKIFRSTEMRPHWIGFLELILLKIFDCYKLSNKVSFLIYNYIVVTFCYVFYCSPHAK